MMCSSRPTALAIAAVALTFSVLFEGAMLGSAASRRDRPVRGQQPTAVSGCRISGRAASGGTPLPGVSVTVLIGESVKGATSSDPDGTYRLVVSPGVYRLTAELTGFARLERDLSIPTAPCDQTVDLSFVLMPRTRPSTPSPAAGTLVGQPAATGRAAQTPSSPAAQPNAQRFQTLEVQSSSNAAASLEVAPPEREAVDASTRLLLPPGFSSEGPTEAVAINGSMASLDRGLMMDRLEAIGRGEFDPATGEFAQGFGPGGRGGPGGIEGGGGRGEFGGRGGGPQGGRGGRAGGPGEGGFLIGGRGGRQNLYSGSTNYTFGGSVLDTAPYQLRADTPAEKRPYTRQNFGGTFGGPLKIPGIYNGTRRTNITVSYAGSHGSNLFDQYATVPTDAMRAGDFSTASTPLVDPATGQPFTGNQIPADRISPSATALLRFIPNANLPGGSRNFHYTTTTGSASDSVNVRLTHNFTPNAGGGRGGRGGGRGGGGPLGGRGGRGRGTPQGTSVVLNAQVQYRKNSADQTNVFPTLGGRTGGSSLALPISVNIVHRRTMHTITVNVSRTANDSVNRYAYLENVAGDAGIGGVSTDPFDWGVPSLSFASLSSVRDLTPSARSDTRLSIGYGWSRPFTRHTVRAGGDVRLDRSNNQTDSNARGAFVFTGLYASGGSPTVRSGGLDFADFLLGLPQQATVQYGPGNVSLSGRSLSLYLQDDWRKSANLTFNLGLRYELLWPFVERRGQMVNLDVTPDFTAAVPVVSGGTGAFTGAFPKALMQADTNNLAPRLGVAWRVQRGTVLRGGYGVSFNAGSYSTIARQLVGQPPFAVTNTSIGTAADPLTFVDPFATASPTETTNNYGVQKDYALGLVQTWNVDLSRELNQAWSVGAGYTHTRGSALDIVRAPNRGPDGLRIPDVQPFLWQTSEGSSRLHAGTFRLARRPIRGIGGAVSYTLARSRDNASSIGGGGTVVAQDDRNLAAEWALSSFDRRHQLSTNLNVELPFGPNRPWLAQGGTWAALLRDWRLSTTFTWQSGTPYTPRVQSAASDVARGTNGTLRADYNGQAIGIGDPTIDRFFNTTAFSIPAPGTFGSAGRNLIIGPGSRQLNAQLARDIRMGGTRALSVQLNASNLLNLVTYGAIDTVVNSPTFGQVTSVRPMRSMQLNLRFRF